MSPWFLLCAFAWFGISVGNTDPAPCILEYSGVITNISFSPNPPVVRTTERLLAELRFSSDVEVMDVRGSVLNEKTGFRFPFMGSLCDMQPTFCPAFKGDVRKIDWSYYIGLVWEANVPSTLEARVVDEYEEIIGQMKLKNCTLLEK